MTTANQNHKNWKRLFVLPAVIAAAFVLTNKAYAAAGGIQICEPGETCEVGEFLYDDEYAAISSASCTITSKDPSGNPYLNDAAMTANSDGWYSYSFTAPTTEGLYRSDVCCTYNSEYLCIDKSFEIKAGSSSPSTGDIAAAVWGYSDRTMTSLGTLVRDIWLHSNRTLTSLNTSSSSSSSQTGNLGDLEEIKRTTKENRLLLEELVNKPIIETSLEEEDLDLSSKLDESQSAANGLYANSQYLRSKTELVISRWNSFSEDELLDILVDLDTIMGDQTDSAGRDSIYGNVKYLSSAWNWKELENLEFEAGVIDNLINSTKVTISTYGKSSLAYKNMKNLLAHFDKVDEYIGGTSDEVTAQTLYGHLHQVSELAKLYSDQIAQVDNILINWNDHQKTDVVSSLNQIASKSVAINQIPQLSKFLTRVDSAVEDKELKNKAFGIRGVLDTNIKLLANVKGNALSNTWLELGSIVFKTVVTNPSTLISQIVPLQYYLPPEVREEHIIKTDNSLKVSYDAERDQYYVSGEFELGPGEVITLSVQVEDIWVITEEEVESIRRQAEELARPLEGTAFFAQSVTLTSDINVSLDKVLALSKSGVTPEAKIRAHREALIEMESAIEKVEKLQELVAQASGSGTLVGFIGGVQTLAVWGLIIIMAAGFIFLALYMKVLKNSEESPVKNKKSNKSKNAKKSDSHNHSSDHPGFNLPSFVKTAFSMIIFGAVVSLSTGAITYKIVSNKYAGSVLSQSDESDNQQDLAESDDLSEAEPNNQIESEAIGGPQIVRINVPTSSRLNVRSEPNLSAEIITQLTTSQEVIKIDSDSAWTKIALTLKDQDNPTEGWVSSDFVIEPSSSLDGPKTPSQSSSIQGKVVIDETPTGWLRVRVIPGGAELTRVYPGDEYELVEELDSYYKISFPDSSEGYVSKVYSSIASDH